MGPVVRRPDRTRKRSVSALLPPAAARLVTSSRTGILNTDAVTTGSSARIAHVEIGAAAIVDAAGVKEPGRSGLLERAGDGCLDLAQLPLYAGRRHHGGRDYCAAQVRRSGPPRVARW